MDDPNAEVAQRAWRVVEPYHAIVYFAPEHREAMDALGLRGGWMAYFASRAAPLGPAPAEVVTALFYNFHPAMVRRALPDAWSHAPTRDILHGRTSAVDRALRRLLGDHLDAVAKEAAPLARAAAEAASVAGRPLYAANMALGWHDAAHLQLWQAATRLREHRGDGHVATLLTEGIDGCEAHLLQVAARRNSRAALQRYRGWSDDEWAAAEVRLANRGLLRSDGDLAPDGRALFEHLERQTDALASIPYRALGRGVERLIELMAELTGRIQRAGAVPYPNPMGVPAADDPGRP